ncbi:MarR family winged helix-turn-helix transcriptional regulator [Taylorella equigenitalis]|uniref:Transcriptional regulator, MarR family n=3 Tax=Taylorella equigenitalis TaxID=29575 RepID=A0A654KHI4_TAYEM|nr:MarR family transcriptional regulator [Taylorella equigenitalis]ADU91894.1 Transcriptional regulator, MarR family [Taylorella equigenitalis MCE9]AFN35458.1 MarR-family transcriptional regulator [Taylorella equigenitalis ATCC 35865]ASY30112.1 MarR family transcriptional regulator [Taylorella equigenitalis]ASY37418.1 MarR family transcriptional regulator [Taylorella equigenitalis]ASY38887.1 MarR family transcriptional regulator [Taylorella equigenitalis]
MDIESRLSSSDTTQARIWLRLNACNQIINRQVREYLRTVHNLTPTRFEILAHINSSRYGLKMGEISERLMVSDGNITNVVKVLEEDGFIRKNESIDDGRTITLNLTTKGKKVLKKAHEGLNELLKELMGDLKETDSKKILKSLSELKQIIDPNSI